MALHVDVVEKAANMAIFSLQGPLDTSTYMILEKHVDAVLAREAMLIVFDMKGVDYISSAGIRVILKAKKALKTRKGQVLLIYLQPQIKKAFDFINALPALEAMPVEEVDMYLHQIQEGGA